MTQAMQFYCVRSLILFLITDLASGEMLYCSKNFDVSFSNRFLNSGSLLALSRISLMISASF